MVAEDPINLRTMAMRCVNFSFLRYLRGELLKYAFQKDMSSKAGPSRTNDQKPSYLRKSELQGKLSALGTELNSIDAEIQALQEARRNVLLEREALQKELAATQLPQQAAAAPPDRRSNKNQDLGASGINYADAAGFEWTPELKKRMRKVFKIQDFRLCQEGYAYVLFSPHTKF
jgi:ATP-dependent DNA helicase Q1